MIEKLPESEPEKEGFRMVELQAEPTDLARRAYKLSFECGDSLTCAAYNRAIEEVMPKHRMGATHHGETNHTPGRHSWEFMTKTSEEKIKGLFSEIQDLAEERFKDYDEAGMKEHWEQDK